jgi:Zn-dependent protease
MHEAFLPAAAAASPSSSGVSQEERVAWRAGSICGISLEIHYTFPVYVVLVLLLPSVTTGGAGTAGVKLYAFTFLLHGVIMLGTTLLHELGHVGCSLYLGGRCDKIMLWPLGGMAYVSPSETCHDDLKIAIAGPLTHLPQFLAWVAVLAFVNDGRITMSLEGFHINGDFMAALAVGAMWINLIMCFFNLFLPAYPLDGGRVLANILLIRGMEPNAAAKVTSSVAMIICCFMIAMGGLQVWQGNSPISILTTFTGCWMGWQAWSLRRLAQMGMAELHPLFAASTRLRVPPSTFSSNV